MTDQANDVGVVLSYIKGIKLAKSKAAWLDADEAALRAAQRLATTIENSRREIEDDSPVVYKLDEERVGELRNRATGEGWFEVPGNAYERLRLIDSATGGVLTVYEGRRGIRAVANVGQRAAQKLLLSFVKGRKG